MHPFSSPPALAIALSICLVSSSEAADGFQHRLDRAAATYEAGQWSRAAEAYADLRTDNPYAADLAYWHGRSLMELGRFDEAADAFREARSLGLSAFDCDFRLAQVHAAAGRPDEALDWLERALVDDAPAHAGAADIVAANEWFEPLRDEPRFRLLTGERRTYRDPEAGRRADLDFVVDRLRRVHFDPFHSLGHEELEARVESLRRRIPELDDAAFVIELARLVAALGDGHTNLWPSPPEGSPVHRLPLMLYRFRSGVFVRAATPELRDLVGSRVVAMGGRSIDDLMASAAEVLSHDNRWQLHELAARVLVVPEFLEWAGAVVDQAEVRLELERDGRSLSARVTGVPYAELEALIAPYLEETPRFDERVEVPSWVSLHAADAPTPLWLRHPYRPYWRTAVDGADVLYVQLNDARQREDLPFERFVESLFEEVETGRPRALVLDLRLNAGGETFFTEPLLRRLAGHPELDRPGRLFVITGRRTSSSAMRFASRLEQWTETVFVGEPTGQPPNAFGGTNVYRLPYTGKELRVSSRFWVGGRTSDDRRPWIAPDIPAELTADQYAAGVDPAMAAILRSLNRTRAR